MAWWNAIIKPVADIFCKAIDVVDELIPDKDLAVKLKAALREKILSLAHTEFMAIIQAQGNIIISEAKGDSWLQRNWRPLIMAEFGAIILNNYIVAPYIGLFFGSDYKVMLEIPPDMWGLLKLGISGYVVGRSMEKIAAGDGLSGMIDKLKKGSGQGG